MASRKTSAAISAERLGGYAKPVAFDAEEQRLQAEFAGLDLTDEEQADLAEALRLRLGNNAEQMAARAVINRLRLALRDAVASTLDHHRQGGGAVERMSKSDAHRILDRDGLAELYSRGRIRTREFDGGVAYRKRYEFAFKGLRSTLGNEVTSISTTITEKVTSRTLLAKYELQRVNAEQRVIQDCGEPALVLLRKVAGEGRAISGLLHKDRRSGRDVDQAVALLARALRLCADLLPLA